MFPSATVADARKPVVLFLCTHNAARSQMAEALLKEYAGEHFDVHSAGLVPTEIHPMTVRVMGEIGVDLEGQYAKGLRQYLGKLAAHFAIMVCHGAEAHCPTNWPGALAPLYWPFDDPTACAGSEEARLQKFREVRDQIDAKIRAWLTPAEPRQL